jgi:hypothetical protein
MRPIWLAMLLLGSASGHSAPPPDADGRFSEWFRNLTVPGSRDSPCCDVADCRMVDARWNSQTQHYEARVIREVFSNGLGKWRTYMRNEVSDLAATRDSWTKSWIATYGNVSEIWIEIPEGRTSHIYNPTGRAVLCWSTFYRDFNGVFCFIPFHAA